MDKESLDFTYGDMLLDKAKTIIEQSPAATGKYIRTPIPGTDTHIAAVTIFGTLPNWMLFEEREPGDPWPVPPDLVNPNNLTEVW